MGANGKKYSSVDEFYLTAVEFCKLVEFTSETEKPEFISKAQKILVFVYLKAILLTKPDEVAEEVPEKFVQEEDWIYIKKSVATILGGADRYININLPELSDPDNYESISLAEGFADIYQDLKDFVNTYEIGNTEAIKVALYDCLLNFEKYWGPRLLAILDFAHNFLYNRELFDDDDDDETPDKNDIDTSDWIINQRFTE